MSAVLEVLDVVVPSSEQFAPTQRKSYYRPQLDGLRFLAFMAVYFQHTFHAGADYYLNWAVLRPLHLSPAAAGVISRLTETGGMGVDLFFALSSYLITELLLREIKQTGKIHLKYFYARRVLRIWPVYGLVLFLGIVLIPALGISGRIPPVFIAGYIFFAGNWSCAFLGSPAVLFTIGPLWSISIEEQFYLLWPLSIQRLGVKHLKWLCAGLLVSAELGRLFMCLLNAPANMRYFSTFTHLDPIAWGALLALGTKDRALRPSVPLRALIGMGCVGIILLALLYEDGSAGYVSDLLITPMYGFCCAAIIFLVLQSQFLAVKPLPYLGKISFGLYAYHAMILVMMDKFVAQGSWVKLLMIPTKLLVTIAVAALSYKFLEAPILKFKERFTLVQSRPV